MSRHLQHEVDRLKKRILQLGTLVEESVEKATRAVTTVDADLAKSVVQSDSEIDCIEMDVEEDCLKILALHQPVAVDLRYVIAVLKIDNDLERVGDLATNIAERALNLAHRPLPVEAHGLNGMVEAVRKMLKMSLDSLVNSDAQLARSVLAADTGVDTANREMFARTLEAMQSRSEELESLIAVQSVSRYLERIADHATNIAEDVIYMLEGEIARHGAGMESPEES